MEVKHQKTFFISRKPVVPLVEREEFHAFREALELPRFYGPPRLLVLARDPWTIFAYWNVDWRSIFKNTPPTDRKVHLRVHSADDLNENEVAIEPMAGMHCLTMSRRHRSCRIEIGFYRPADIWHSVAISDEMMMPRAETAKAEDVDLATIPFHLTFQQLAELYGAKGDPLATVISRHQGRAVRDGESEMISPDKRKIVRETGIAVSEVVRSRRDFNQTDDEKLRKRCRGLLGLDVTSPARGFEAGWTSGGS